MLVACKDSSGMFSCLALIEADELMRNQSCHAMHLTDPPDFVNNSGIFSFACFLFVFCLFSVCLFVCLFVFFGLFFSSLLLVYYLYRISLRCLIRS